jgi:hypothetical protein
MSYLIICWLTVTFTLPGSATTLLQLLAEEKSERPNQLGGLPMHR